MGRMVYDKELGMMVNDLSRPAMPTLGWLRRNAPGELDAKDRAVISNLDAIHGRPADVEPIEKLDVSSQPPTPAKRTRTPRNSKKG